MVNPIPSASPTRRIWLHVGTLLDGTSTTPARDAHVVYDSQRIHFVGTNGNRPPPDILADHQTAPDVSAPDATLLPGLIEAHAHLFLEGGELDFEKRATYLTQTADELLAAAQPRLAQLVTLGITGVRDAGDKDGVGLALSRQYKRPAAERPLMPYYDSPGAAIHHEGRYGKFMGETIEAHGSIDATVDARVAAGADRIKLLPTGIINFKKGLVTAKPQMDTAEVSAIVAAAKRHGRQTFAHSSGDIGIDHAIDGGVDTIEHGFFLRDDQLAKLRDQQIGWVPTFAPVQKQVDHAVLFGWDEQIVGNLQRILDNHARSLVKAHDMGVLIIAGSDAGSCGVAHGLGFLYELEQMEKAGLSALAVINAATGVSAGRLAYADPIGRIAPDHLPRMILTTAPVLDSVTHLRAPKTVIFDDQVLIQDKTFSPTGL
ncbi:amidohydrolase family protein [Actomonas aquatica]|uniref:Amidohydrolase family protein n=1 Tax=Actomonas aquatica TaxID=2866162 RepID=A0ABZ1C3E0_9BACT|nr:amidohydrolase family protein [Opitutus sp. WL0086]WRQ85867.1 amidohydrolase family protein [Opitutus sp. WL0086]